MPTLNLSFDGPVKNISYPDVKKQIFTFSNAICLSLYHRKQLPRGYLLPTGYLKVYRKSLSTKLFFGKAAN